MSTTYCGNLFLGTPIKLNHFVIEGEWTPAMLKASAIYDKSPDVLWNEIHNDGDNCLGDGLGIYFFDGEPYLGTIVARSMSDDASHSAEISLPEATATFAKVQGLMDNLSVNKPARMFVVMDWF